MYVCVTDSLIFPFFGAMESLSSLVSTQHAYIYIHTRFTNIYIRNPTVVVYYARSCLQYPDKTSSTTMLNLALFTVTKLRM